ncbi:MAG: cytochrome c [Ignavibacteriaceae bacterium]
MTGMPAWGKTHSDEKIWTIVAFMKKLPNMSGEEYEKMESETSMEEEVHAHQDENEHLSLSDNKGEHH